MIIRAVPHTSIWFGLFFWVLLGGALLVFTSWWLYEDFLFTFDSKSVVGIVEQKYETVSHDRHGDNYTDHLVYQYKVGRMAMGSDSIVQRGTYDSVSKGSSIPLLYLPEELTNNRIEMPLEIQLTYWTTIGLVAGSLASTIGGVFVLRYYVRQNQLNRFLRASGMQCQGIVTAVNSPWWARLERSGTICFLRSVIARGAKGWAGAGISSEGRKNCGRKAARSKSISIPTTQSNLRSILRVRRRVR